MKQLLRKITRTVGLDIVSYPHFSEKQRLALFKRFDIRTIVDIGANQGQYATYMRGIGFEGTIISFEPVRATYEKLSSLATGDVKWVTKNMAFGDTDMEATINVSENTLSSSLLPPLDGFLHSTPEAKVVSQEKVKVVKLDTWVPDLLKNEKNYFLKVDAQGYERKILEGAQLSLHHFAGIQIELSLTSLYEGENTFFELFPLILSKGFKLYVMENGYCNPVTGEVLQLELILFRND
ncbi:MAG TPA: FkbM family methyltransferase [Puia sp.]|nr:FkbM family methyltransferase [Puia sp.]